MRKTIAALLGAALAVAAGVSLGGCGKKTTQLDSAAPSQQGNPLKADRSKIPADVQAQIQKSMGGGPAAPAKGAAGAAR